MIKCEKCGAELTELSVNCFCRDGSDAQIMVPVEAYGDAVMMEVSKSWTGYELSEEERLDTISCPYCRKFPFKYRGLNSFELIQIVCFRSRDESEDDE